MNTSKNLKRQFLHERGIDLTDYEVAGKFPYFNKKKDKWVSISRGEAWARYAAWLEGILDHTIKNSN